MKLRLVRFVGCLAVVLIPPTLGAKTDQVVVSASAAPHYQRELPGGGLRPETYTFIEGKYFPGNSRSRSLSSMTFETIVRTLAVDLARQNYRPAPEPLQADLLLMVHWGLTEVFEPEDPVTATDRLNSALQGVRDAVDAGDLPYMGELNERLMEQQMTGGQVARSIQQNARLLGYNVSLEEETQRPFGSPLAHTMQLELSEERYFVIIMAYDYRAIREEKRRDVLWIARLSVPARGHNFYGALPAMSQVGGDYFGQRMKSLQRVRVNVGRDDTRRAITEIGELEVVEEPPAPPRR
jgi:hypothetical protein